MRCFVCCDCGPVRSVVVGFKCGDDGDGGGDGGFMDDDVMWRASMSDTDAINVVPIVNRTPTTSPLSWDDERLAPYERPLWEARARLFASALGVEELDDGDIVWCGHCDCEGIDVKVEDVPTGTVLLEDRS